MIYLSNSLCAYMQQALKVLTETFERKSCLMIYKTLTTQQHCESLSHHFCSSDSDLVLDKQVLAVFLHFAFFKSNKTEVITGHMYNAKSFNEKI